MNVLQLSVSLVGLLSCLVIERGQSHSQYGIAYAHSRDNERHGSYCFMYNPLFKQLPLNQDDAVEVPLSDLSSSLLCDGVVARDVRDTVVAVARGNCSSSEKALAVQNAGGVAVLIISNLSLRQPTANSSEQYNAINITVGRIQTADFSDMKNLGSNLTLRLFSPTLSRYDYNMIVMWLVAVGTVAIGGYWSGVVKHKQSRLELHRTQTRIVDGTPVPANRDHCEDSEDVVDVTLGQGIIFVVLLSVFLMSLYYFYKYLVYVIIGVFALASAVGLYTCLEVIMLRLPFIGGCRIRQNKLLKNGLDVRCVVLAALCAGVSIWWLVERNKSYAWVLQDFLGIAFCINALRLIRLKSLKTCTIILSFLFVYDVFFVFITPLFLPDGRSIMIDVATGAGSTSREKLPVVMRIPRLSMSGLSQCFQVQPYSMLGFGDILAPGVLVAYCHGFDLKVGSGRVYFLSLVSAYGVGLVLTFLALLLMSVAQPALLYLVPCTLVPTFLIGWRRKEFRHLWTGDKDTTSDSVTSTQDNADACIQANGDSDTQANDDTDAQVTGGTGIQASSVIVSPVESHEATPNDDNSAKCQLLERT